eukprot:SAG22_NODE_991_length_6129_cov_8.370813_2_plen_78_part_00
MGAFDRNGYLVGCKALPFCCASTVFLSKTVPFLAVCLSQDYGKPAGHGSIVFPNGNIYKVRTPVVAAVGPTHLSMHV